MQIGARSIKLLVIFIICDYGVEFIYLFEKQKYQKTPVHSIQSKFQLKSILVGQNLLTLKFPHPPPLSFDVIIITSGILKNKFSMG
jgi:hypothetical protein